MPPKTLEPEAPQTKVRATYKDAKEKAVYWSRNRRHVCGPHEFVPFFPDDPYLVRVPGGASRVRDSEEVAGYKSEFSTSDPAAIETMEKMLAKRPGDLRRMFKGFPETVSEDPAEIEALDAKVAAGVLALVRKEDVPL